MSTTRSTTAFAGVSGVQFQTDAVPGSTQERQLQGIQFKLAGKEWVGSAEPIAHLRLTEQVGGPTVIGLWVPEQQQAEAERLLTADGFEVSPPVS